MISKKTGLVWNLISFCIITLTISASAQDPGTNTFTGAVNANWYEPGNWSEGHCPTYSDYVLIPEGKTVAINTEGDRIDAKNITNNGTIKIEKTSFQSIASINAGNYFTNNGTIEGDDIYLTITGYKNFDNRGTIKSNDTVKIFSSGKATNLEAGKITGGSLEIFGLKGIDNKGEMVSGNATDTKEAGHINLYAGGEEYESGDINNWGMIRLGNGGSNSRGGKAHITAKNVNCFPGSYLFGGMGAVFGGIIRINVRGKLVIAGESATGTGIPAVKNPANQTEFVNLDDYTYYKMTGDTIIFAGAITNTYGDYILARANVIKFEAATGSNVLMAENGITLETPPGGTIDFSGLTTENSISTTSDSIFLYSDNIVPPAAGIGSISEQPVVPQAANDEQVDAELLCLGQKHATLTADTVIYNLQNTGTKEQSFSYSVSSELGSCTAEGSTPVLGPFESTILEVLLYRPENVTTDTLDTLTLTVSGDNDFSTSLTTTVSISKDIIISDVPEKAAMPENYFLVRTFPNPFNPATNVVFNLDKLQNVSFKVVNVMGKVVYQQKLGRLNAGEHTISWDGSQYASGTYYMVIETESAKCVTKALMLK